MCGITGIFAFNEVGRFNMINLSKATALLEKRGPDNQGMFTDYYVGLGHRRLSIIDTSSASHQPMKAENDSHVIIFNGEIYNYRQLKEDLIQKGITFKTESDTEVLLQLFIMYREKCLEMLHGFFSFAIYDKADESIFIARDRIGIKPLLYYIDDDKFIFGSEMKSVMAYGIEKKIDYDSLAQYFQFNYIIAPDTIIDGVKKLMPGHYAKIKSKEIDIRSFYEIPYEPTQLPSQLTSYEQLQETLIEKLEASVQERLIADVPLGAFLSGGIDSSVITALASRHKENLNTFSIGYRDEPYFDETKYANLVAKKFNTNHTVFSLSNLDLYEHLNYILDYIDEPFADSSAIPVYILSQHTRKVATVALSGDGADELFSGYNKHMAAYRALHGGFSANMVESFLPLWKIMPKSRNNPLTNKFRQFQRFAQGMKLEDRERYWQWAGFADQHEVLRMFNLVTQEKISKTEYSDRKRAITGKFKNSHSINDILYADMHLVLTNDMLTKVDSMSMANSLEVRVPFLDHRVVNFAFSLHEDAKINSKMKKRILQDAFRQILPAELYRRPKHGFEVPLLKWFRNELRSLIENDLLSKHLIESQGIFEYRVIAQLKKKLFSSNPEDVHARIWALIVFQHWWKKYLGDSG